MKDWFTVEPDKYALVGSHRYTAGRSGKSIQYVTRHHIMGDMTTERVRDLWNNEREASAHYVVENSGLVGQIVYDGNTAWSNGNAASNLVSVSIEHANNTGRYAGNDYHDKSWNISETVIREGAKLGAALCWFYKLGRPALGKNIRDHNEFTATGCPVHLKRGGKYSDQWMRIAQEHYDWMVAGGKTPESKPQEGITVSEADRIIKHLTDFIAGFVGPVGSDIKDVREQITGGRDAGEYPGWPQLGQNAEGADLTLVDAVAALRRDLDGLRKEIKR